MTDQTKIPAPEPVVEFVGVLRWRIPHTHYVLPHKYLRGHHLFCSAADVEAYAAAREEAARVQERERCAKVCEDAKAKIWHLHPAEVIERSEAVCDNLAAAIRAG